MTPLGSTVLRQATARQISDAVRRRQIPSRVVVQATLDHVAQRDGALNCFTRVFASRALLQADAVDVLIARGEDPGPLAGVPFAVKDLFDVSGEPTTAGSMSRIDAAPAERDAELVRRLTAAGAILIGSLNMDEFAYGFSTENARFGATRNPHDVMRLAGGSSGGAAAAVAAGLVPITLGSDTNGSVRVPASLCGVFGLRPTFGALSLDGVYPFVDRLDTAGVFTRTQEDLRLALPVLGLDVGTPRAIGRTARLGGWFRRNVDPRILDGVDAAAGHLGAHDIIELPTAGPARSAAYVLTALEGGRRHIAGLRARMGDFDPVVRERLLAGALAPERLTGPAEAVAARFVAELEDALSRYDLLIAPSTPILAPPAAASTVIVDGVETPARASLGLLTQPISLAGVPVLSAPAGLIEGLPFGVQLIAARERESQLLDAAALLRAEAAVPRENVAC